MILTVTLNPSVDKILEVPDFHAGKLNTIDEVSTQPGGKGVNVAIMLRSLGHDVVAAGFAGSGPGRMVQNSLRDLGITTAFTLVEEKTRTNYIILDKNAGVITQIRQDGPQITPYDLEQFRRTYERLITTADIVLIAGSLPPGAEPSFCAELVRLATHRNIRVALNIREPIMAASMPAGPFLAEPDLRNVDSYGPYDLTDHDQRVALVREIGQDASIAVVHAGGEALLVAENEAYSISIPACGLLGRIRLDDALTAGMIDAVMSGGAIADVGREGVAGALAAAASPTGRFASRDDIDACTSQVEVKPLA